VFGHEGEIWVPLGSGLVRSTNSGASFSTVAGVQQASFVAFGKAAAGQSYPAVFISGRANNASATGIYRSDNAGASWVRINDDQHQFGLGSIHTFCADPRVYGRVYFGTEGRGIVYGAFANPPAVPTILSAIAADSQVTLSWTASLGAASYNLKRSLASGGSYSVVVTNTSLAFTNTGLSDGTRYYFVVSSVNSAGESANSTEVSAQPMSQIPPQLGFTLTGNQLQLAWPPDHIGWLLQVQTNGPGAGLGTNWIDLPGSTSTNQSSIEIDPANGSVFFRLVHP
jgi:hypothetical protein